MKVSELLPMLNEVEQKIINDYPNARSNKATMFYFVQLGFYKYLGGTVTVEQRLNKNGILNHLPTEKAKQNYIKNAKNYSEIAYYRMKVNRYMRTTRVVNGDTKNRDLKVINHYKKDMDNESYNQLLKYAGNITNEEELKELIISAIMFKKITFDFTKIYHDELFISIVDNMQGGN